jgi:5-carboxymethyl-2-hydroxymuconate isomerase
MKTYNYIHIKLPINDGRDSSITKEEYNKFLEYIKDYYGRGDGRSFAMFIKDSLNRMNNELS